jgi:hypothetical protein
MSDPRFPAGKFHRPGEYTLALRSQHLHELELAPRYMRQAVSGLSPAQLDTPYRADGWTVRQVVHHVPDSHMNSYIRFKLALTEDNPTIKPYAEDKWAELKDSRMPIEGSIALLDHLHDRWTCLLKSLDEDQWKRSFVHPENGPMPLPMALALYAWHSRHHVAHITSLRDQKGWSNVRPAW